MFPKMPFKIELLLALFPAVLLLDFMNVDNSIIFVISVVSIIPLAKIIGKATEELAIQSGSAFGALMNATFGNIVELIIAVFAIQSGLIEVVKASITGSIIGNLLFLIGLSMFFGGLKYKEQTFNKDAAGISSTMLIIAVAGLVIPTVYLYTTSGPAVQSISMIVSFVLALIYICGLIFTFKTHKRLFDVGDEFMKEKIRPVWSKRKSLAVLVGAIAAVSIVSEILVGSIGSFSKTFETSEMFIGLVVIAIITNIAEKMNAITFARKNKISLSLEIGTSSATQIALFVVPILVIVSSVLGHPLSLVFSLFELVAIILAVMITNYISTDGRCNWLEGAQLITVYLIIITAFYFV